MDSKITRTLIQMKEKVGASDDDIEQEKGNLLSFEAQELYSRGFNASEIYHLIKEDATQEPFPWGMSKIKRMISQSIEKYKQENNLQGAEEYIADPVSHVKRYEKEIKAWGKVPILKTGISSLDSAYGGGLLPGQLMVLTGGEGSMKTSLALTMVEDYLMSVGDKVLFFSLDMEAERIALRRLLPLMNCGYKELIGAIQQDSREYLNALEKRQEIDNGNFRIVDGPHTLDSIKKKILLENPSVVIIDYLTCIEGFSNELDTARESIKRIREWKRDGYTFVTLNQLSEQSKSNQRHGFMNPPAMGGGSSQQAADVKIDLFKDVEPNEDVPWKQIKKPRIVATVSKTRDAIAGKHFVLDYDGPTMSFTGRAKEVEKVKEQKSIFGPVSLPE